MESDTRKPRQTGQAQGRAMNGEKSPAGSVKRARQRAAAGLQPEQNQDASYTTPSSMRSPNKSPYTPPDFSRPRPPGRQDQSFSRGPAPQRPPRPNFVPPMPQFPQSQGNFPPYPQYPNPQSQSQLPRRPSEENSNGSSSSSRPLTTSTSSSNGSIPEFPPTPAMPPVPLFQPPPRRNLGPPPSARKGGSSYYSQTSFVPPIPEEMSEHHSSYASSHVIPESWGDGPPEYYMGGGIDEEDEDVSQGGNSGRGSSAGDHDELSDLMRKGSHGRTRTQHLETLESEDESDRGTRSRGELDRLARQDERWPPNPPGTDPIGRHNFRDNGRLNANLYSGYESDAAFLDSPRSRSPMPNLNTNSQYSSNPYYGNTPSIPGSPIDPRVGEILGHLEKGGALASSGTASPDLAPSIHEKGFKRPPRLNLESSKEGGHGRGSATSLPELIRRATKLASNLNQGKTASQVGMLDLLTQKEKEKEAREKAVKGDGSISDILAAFPSPSPTTPTAQRPAGWPTPSPHGKSALSRAQTPGYGSSVSHRPRSRKCCGLPVWAFILLLIILLLLIAAAVIIPITLVVIPREHKNDAPDLSSCQSSLPCANGGSSVIVNNKCRCICSNGFLGSTCNTPADTGCTSTDFPSSQPNAPYRNATLGDSIPRILNSAKTNFSIPITPYTILSLFSATNLSCASENALITFNQKAQRRDTAQLPLPDAALNNDPVLLPLAQILHSPSITHNHASRVLHARTPAQTTNGILFDTPPVDTAGGAPAPAAPTSSTNTPSSSSNQKDITQHILDFSRTAVLFILQETSSLDQATTALDHLQATLSSGKTFDASQTIAGGNITVDLSALTVGFGNGTLYGGKSMSSS